MKKNIWLALLCLSVGVNATPEEDANLALDWAGDRGDALSQDHLDRVDAMIKEHGGNEAVASVLNGARKTIKETLRSKAQQQQPVVQQQPAPAPVQQPAPAAPINWQMPVSQQEDREYIQAVTTILNHSVEDLLINPKIENILKEFYRDYGGKDIFTENQVKVAGEKAMIVDAKREGKLEEISKAIVRQHYPEGLKNNNGLNNNDNWAEEVAKIDAVYRARNRQPKQVPQGLKNNNGLNNNDDLAEEVANIDAVYRARDGRFQQRPQSDEDADLQKAIEASKKTAEWHNTWGKESLSDEEFAERLPQLGRDTWRKDLKKSTLSEEEQSQIAMALSNTSEENKEKRLKQINRKLANKEKKASKQKSQIAMALSNTSEENKEKRLKQINRKLANKEKKASKQKKASPMDKLSAMMAGIIARPFFRTFQSISEHNNIEDILGDFEALLGKHYLNKSPEDQSQCVSDFQEVESFLILGKTKTKNKKELQDVMQKVVKYGKIVSDTIRSDYLSNQFNQFSAKVSELINWVGNKPMTSLLGHDSLGKQLSHRIDSLSKTFGLFDSKHVQSIIQDKKSKSSVWGLEESKAVIEGLIPEKASDLDTVCEKVIGNLGSKKQVLEKLVANIFRRVSPSNAPFGMPADRAKISSYLGDRIEQYVVASKKRLNTIQEEVDSDEKTRKANRLNILNRLNRQKEEAAPAAGQNHERKGLTKEEILAKHAAKLDQNNSVSNELFDKQMDEKQKQNLKDIAALKNKQGEEDRRPAVGKVKIDEGIAVAN